MQVDFTIRVAYTGKDKNGEPERGMVGVTVVCDGAVPVREAVAAARVKALKDLNAAGRSDLRIGGLYKPKFEPCEVA